MAIPPPLVRLIHIVLVDHFRRHHGDDPDRAENFAEAFADRLLGPLTTAEAGRAADQLDILPLPSVFAGADENYRLAGALRDNLCRKIREWLFEARVWRHSADLKALAYARAIAIAADGATYVSAVQNAKLGLRPADPDEDVMEHERNANEAERRYAEGWRWR